MNGIRSIVMLFAGIGGALLCLVLGVSTINGQEVKTPKLGKFNDSPPIVIVLGKSPDMRFLLWRGHAIVLAQVVLQPTDEQDTFKARIVKLDRLSYDSKKKEYTHRFSPQITKIPFTCENGLTYTLLDGLKWELGSDFTISKKDLQQRVQSIPAYGPDPRNPIQIVGWVQAEAIIDRIKPLPKK